MQTTEVESVSVAVGVIRRDNLFLIAKRPEHLHQGGLWEFPGGKIQSHESKLQALARELSEEVDIQINKEEAQHLFSIPWNYSDKAVILETYLVEQFFGGPKGKEGQPIKWVTANELEQYSFPDANTQIINWILENP